MAGSGGPAARAHDTVAAPGQRCGAADCRPKRKQSAVLRLLRGEDQAARPTGWRLRI
jgi:hypothetical protein